MIRRPFATLLTGAVLGGALLAPVGLVAKDTPGAPKQDDCGGGGCCGDEAKTPAPAKQEGCCGDEAKTPAPAKQDDCGDCGGCEGVPIKAPGDAAKAGDAKTPAKPDEQKMMEAFMALGRPGAAHRKLDALVGTWTVTNKVWHDPSGAPMESTGTCVNAWALGGRFLEQRSFGTMPCGTEFEGHGYTGFDNATGKYVGLWLDSMSTGVLFSTGQADSTGKVFSFLGEMKGPEGMTLKYRHQVEIVSTDKHVFTLWQTMGGGPETKMMEAVYTRR